MPPTAWFRGIRRKWIAALVLLTCVSGLLTLIPHFRTAPREDENLAFAEIDDDRFAFVAASRGGESVFVARDLSGMVYRRPDGRSATILLRENGLPRRVLDSGYIIDIANYRADRMDVAVTAPDGRVQTVRDVELPAAVRLWMVARGADGSFQQALLSASADVPKPLRQIAGPEGVLLAVQIRSDLLQRPSDWISIAGIGIGVGITAAAAVSAAPIVAVGLVLVGGASAGLGLYSMLVDDSRGAWGSAVVDSAMCASVAVGNPQGAGSCLTAGITVANEVFVKALEEDQQREEQTRLARSALLHGTGDVQMTLTWDAPCDVDLWCRAPSGAQIGFSRGSSPCGGRLDVDDRDGYGPENIFWPRGAAPRGAYQVWVHHYEGSQAAGYKVLIRVDGRETTLTGRLVSKEASTPHTFAR